MSDERTKPEPVLIPANTPWLKMEEAAEYLRISESKVLALSGARVIPTYKLGGRVVYKKDDLDAYAERNKRRAFEPAAKATAKVGGKA